MKPPIIMVPMPTPCSPTGEPDLEGLARLSQDMIDKKCDALFVLSSTGRGPWFGNADRDRIIETAVESAHGEIPVFVGCQSAGLSPMLDYADRAADLGATGIVVTAPTYFSYSADELRRIFLAVADRSSLPVIVYDVPMYAGSRFSEDAILELAGHGNVAGLKDTTGDIERFVRIAGLLEQNQNFLLLQGNERYLIKSLAAGGNGVVSTFCVLAPNLFVSLHRAWMESDSGTAMRHQEKIREMYEIVVSWRKRMPEISTVFYLVNHVLRATYPEMNILLDHERDFPEQLYRDARRFRELCRSS